MKVSAETLDHERGLLAPGHQGGCHSNSTAQGKEESETLISTLSLRAHHPVLQSISGSMIVSMPELLWLKAAFIMAVKKKKKKTLPLYSLLSLEFYAHLMPKKCFL